MSEMALTTAKRAVLDHEAEEGDRRAARAAELASDSGNFLATIQVAITLVGFASSAVASTNLSDPLAQWLRVLASRLSAVAPGLAPVIITLIVSYLSIVVGELVLKTHCACRRGGYGKARGPAAHRVPKDRSSARVAYASICERPRRAYAHQERG